VGSNAPQDKPVSASGRAEIEAVEQAIAPYSERDRELYPDAKRRFLAGLPPGHQFAVVTKLHSPGQIDHGRRQLGPLHGHKPRLAAVRADPGLAEL
jgi:hypothetical protein